MTNLTLGINTAQRRLSSGRFKADPRVDQPDVHHMQILLEIYMLL